MGNCTFCGQSAGFLRRVHKECEQRHESGKSRIVDIVSRAGAEGGNLRSLNFAIKEIASLSYINGKAARACIIAGYEQAVARAFDDGILSAAAEASLWDLGQHFSIPQAELDANGAVTQIVQGRIIRELLNGVILERKNVDGPLPFNFQKSEKLVWVFQDVKYYEEKTKPIMLAGLVASAFALLRECIIAPAPSKVSA